MSADGGAVAPRVETVRWSASLRVPRVLAAHEARR